MGMSPLEAFHGATVNGARALALQDRGRLTEGQTADLVLWSVQTPAQVIYEFANDLPRTVFVGGRKVAG